MKNHYLFISACFCLLVILSACKKKKEGCTDPSSINYDSEAEVDDGSCQYARTGCMDPVSIDYDSLAEVDNGTCRYAGTGGHIDLIAKPRHHSVPIVGSAGYVDSVFIKFNTESYLNNSSSYDLTLAGLPGEDHVLISGLKPGKYFIFMSGFDTTGPYRVSGGAFVVLTQDSIQTEVVIPVTE